jgi:alginate O-acetyltransferase complex protein AlgJ
VSIRASPRGTAHAGTDLRPEHVAAVFREFLGRVATPGDIAIWMQTGSLHALMDGVLGSEEYAQRLARRDLNERAQAHGRFVNCWIPGWEGFARPPGEISPDGVAIVGDRGHIFIYGGTNNNVASHRGEVEMAGGWMDAWRDLVNERIEHARNAGRRIACLVVPEKLAVYGDVFPQDLTARGLRPVQSLLEVARLPLVYPEDALRDRRADGDTYLRTDSHLTALGNILLARATMTELGVAATMFDDLPHAPHPHLGAGDLGLHFDPPVMEVMTPMAGASRATLISDNWAQIVAVGGHIGTMRVFRREDAADQRTVVVFGDSYSFGDEAYQGLSWFLAQAFREVHFVWVPFGWDPDYLDSVSADLVVCQTAERFIGRVPNTRVDVRALEQETITRNRALTEASIFSD